MGEFLVQKPLTILFSIYPKRMLPVKHGSLCINPVLEAIQKCKHQHFRIFLQQNILGKDQSKFDFHFITLGETIKEVALLRASQVSDIPVEIIMQI